MLTAFVMVMRTVGKYAHTTAMTTYTNLSSYVSAAAFPTCFNQCKFTLFLQQKLQGRPTFSVMFPGLYQELQIASARLPGGTKGPNKKQGLAPIDIHHAVLRLGASSPYNVQGSTQK
jgi:hypothetical protein